MACSAIHSSIYVYLQCAINVFPGSVFPPSWKPTPAGKPYGITELSSNESEFKTVTKRLMETKGDAPIRGIIKANEQFV